MENAIETNLLTIRELIGKFEQKYGRTPGSVKLLAASKFQPLAKLESAIKLGQHAFGENYLQEALEKISFLANESLEWHFIGSIQHNKTKKIAEHFSWVHSIASEKIAQRLNDQRPPSLPPLNVCIEVNMSGESSKSGITIEDAKRLVEVCASLPRLKLRGFMTIPAPSDHFDEQLKPFTALAELLALLQKKYPQLDTLSMGMSEDYEAAIAAGATIVRIGSAIFGERIRP